MLVLLKEIILTLSKNFEFFLEGWGLYYGENYITLGGKCFGRSFEGSVGRPVIEAWSVTWNWFTNPAFPLGPR